MTPAESKKDIKFWDDVRNAFDNLVKNKIDSPSVWHSRMFERYEEGSLAVHLHILGRLDGHPWCGCAECYRDGHEATGIAPRAHVLGNDLHLFNTSDSQHGQDVLVLLCKRIQGQQSLIPSIVRLNALDDINGRCGKGRFLRQIKRTIRVQRTFLDDGKINAISSDDQLRGSVFGGKLPSNIIEGSSKIADTISDKATQVNRRLDLYKRPTACYISLAFDGELIRVAVQIMPNFRIERIQVFLSPDDFESSPVQTVDHTANLCD